MPFSRTACCARLYQTKLRPPVKETARNGTPRFMFRQFRTLFRTLLSELTKRIFDRQRRKRPDTAHDVFRLVSFVLSFDYWSRNSKVDQLESVELRVSDAYGRLLGTPNTPNANHGYAHRLRVPDTTVVSLDFWFEIRPTYH